MPPTDEPDRAIFMLKSIFILKSRFGIGWSPLDYREVYGTRRVSNSRRSSVGKPGGAEVPSQHLAANRILVRVRATECPHAEGGLLLQEHPRDAPRLVEASGSSEARNEDPLHRGVPGVLGGRHAGPRHGAVEVAARVVRERERGAVQEQVRIERRETERMLGAP